MTGQIGARDPQSTQITSSHCISKVIIWSTLNWIERKACTATTFIYFVHKGPTTLFPLPCGAYS